MSAFEVVTLCLSILGGMGTVVLSVLAWLINSNMTTRDRAVEDLKGQFQRSVEELKGQLQTCKTHQSCDIDDVKKQLNALNVEVKGLVPAKELSRLEIQLTNLEGQLKNLTQKLESVERLLDKAEDTNPRRRR